MTCNALQTRPYLLLLKFAGNGTPSMGMAKGKCRQLFTGNRVDTTGAMIHYHLGCIAIAAGTVLPCCTSAEEAEAIALLEWL
jgi:hypothetical protein